MLVRDLFLAVAALSAGACVSTNTTVVPMASFKEAVDMADPNKPENPPLLCNGPFAEELVSYAYIDGVGSNKERLADAAWQRSLELMPDVLIYLDGGVVTTGSVTTNWGFGVSSSDNVYRNTCRVLLCRKAPCVLPFVADYKGGLVRVVQASAKDSGLLEGDTILSIGIDGPGSANVVWNELMQSLAARLHLQVGQKISVIATRPGTGRVEATVTTVENPLTCLKGQTMIDKSGATVVTTTGSNAQPCWGIRRYTTY
jgi:hypothetical protein